jgi:hypothetical protein
MDFTGMLWEYVDWFDLAYDRGKLRAVVNTGINFRVPYYAENFLTG